MAQHIIVCVIGLLLWFCFTANAAVPRLEGAKKYLKENISIMDDSYSVGIWDLQFDQELYTYQGWGSSQCFSNTSCLPSDIVCPPCDWTDPLVCSGIVRGTGSPCPCPSPPNVLCTPQVIGFPFYNFGANDTSIIMELSTDTGGISDYVFYPRPPNNCSCIVFKYDLIDGDVAGLIIYFAETLTGGARSGIYVLSRHGIVTVCPSDPHYGETYFGRLIIGPKYTYAKVNVSLEYRPHPWVNGNPHSSSCTVPPELAGTHQCVPTGVLVSVFPPAGGSFIRIVIDPPANERCGTIGFWQSGAEHLFSTNPWVSPENSTNAFRCQRNGAPDSRPYPSLYPYCLQTGERLYAYILSNTKVDVLADTSKDWLLHRPLSEYPPTEIYRRTFASITAVCPNGNFTAHRQQYTISETMNTGSGNLRVLYSSDDVDVFSPPPLFASDPYYLVRQLPKKPRTPNRLIVSLLLEQRLVTRVQPIIWTYPWLQNAYQWLTVPQWEQCELSLNGRITGADGLPLIARIRQKDITGGLPSCDSEAYFNASRAIDEIQSETSDLVSLPDANLNDVYRLWFLQDRYASSNDFYSCKVEVERSYTTKPLPDKVIVTSQCVAPFGTLEFEEDPCCVLNNTNLYDNCRSTQRVLSGQYELDTIDSDQLLNCTTTQCAQLSITNYVIETNLLKDPTACSNTLSVPDEENVYWHCLDKIWGPEAVSFPGKNCTHDIDCNGTSLCSVHTKRCSIDIATAEAEVISCIYDGVSQFSRISIANELDINASAPNIKQLWQDSFSNVMSCSHPTVPVGFDVHQATYAKCVGCTQFVPNTTNYISTQVVSVGNNYPQRGFDCWAPGSAACSVTAEVTLFADRYCASLGCNYIPYEEYAYFPFIAEPSYCRNDTFCGISDDDFFYQNVTDVIPVASCNNAVLCILANGTKIQTPDEATCTSIFSCDVPCAGGPCPDQASCLAAGSCSDSTDYNIAIWARIYETETAGCFFNVRYREPFNPTSSICEPPFRNTIIGCSLYPGPSGQINAPIPIDRTSCLAGNFPWGDPSVQDLINPRWLTPAKTEAECQAYGHVCDDPAHPTRVVVPAYTATYRFGGCTNPTYLFQWTAGRWLPGQPRIATTVVGKLAPRFSNVSRTGLHLPKLLGNLTKAVEKLQALQVQSTAYCRLSYKAALDQLICNCVEGGPDSICYTPNSNITAIGVVCSEPGTVVSEDLLIEVAANSLPLATCDNLLISSSSILVYQERVLTTLRTLLVNYEEDSKWAVRNENLGIYGKVLTNGYSAIFDTKISNVEFCIRLSPFRADYKRSEGTFPVLDLAKKNASDPNPDSLVPLGLNVTNPNGTDYLCAPLPHFEKNLVYYFIQRTDGDYRDVERRVFSDGEIAYISVLLALYCIGLITSTLKLCYVLYVMIASKTANLLRLACVLFLMATFFLFRVVLFSMLLNQGLLGTGSSRAISYLLFEFPILLYFAFVTNYICIWISAVSFATQAKWQDHRRNVMMANGFSVLLNLIILTLFILIIILYETIIFKPYFICGGAILLFDDDQAFALVLAYRIIFSSIAIVLGITLSLVAFRLGNVLRDPQLSISWGRRIRVYGISIIGGLGLIGQAIYFLIVTATKSTPVNYASLSILLVLEIIPALLFVFVESVNRPDKINSGKGNTTMKASKGSSSAGSGSMNAGSIKDVA